MRSTTQAKNLEKTFFTSRRDGSTRLNYSVSSVTYFQKFVMVHESAVATICCKVSFLIASEVNAVMKVALFCNISFGEGNC